MNEIIKVHNDKFAQKIYNEIEQKLSELEFDSRFEGKRKKYTYSLVEFLQIQHPDYNMFTVYAYWEFLAVTSVDFKNYLDVINPQYVVDIEFITEIISLFEKTATDLHEHLCEIDSKITEYYV